MVRPKEPILRIGQVPGALLGFLRGEAQREVIAHASVPYEISPTGGLQIEVVDLGRGGAQCQRLDDGVAHHPSR